MAQCVRWGSLTPQGNRRFVGRTPQPKRAKCCHLANTDEELGVLATAIPPFAELFRSLLSLLLTSVIVAVESAVL